MTFTTPEGFVMGAAGLLIPTAIDDMRKARVGADQRQKRGRFFSDYSAYAYRQQYGAVGKPFGTPSFPFLRELSRSSMVDRLIIGVRREQVKRVARHTVVPGTTLGFRVVHSKYSDPNFEVSEDIQGRCEEVEQIIASPNPEAHATFRDFMAAAVDEQLIMDRKAMVIYRDYEGKPVTYHLLPGDTIKPIAPVIAQYMMKKQLQDESQALEMLSNELGYDCTKAAWVQDINGKIVAAWTSEEMVVDITNPTIELDRVLYGRSMLEESLEATRGFLFAWRYNQDMFRNSIPDQVMMLYGDYDPRGLESFRRQLNGEAGPGGQSRLVVLPAGPQTEGVKGELLKVRDSMRDMAYPELLRLTVSLKCAFYRMHPATINIAPDSSGQRTLMMRVNDQQVIEAAEEEGFRGLLDQIAAWLTRTIVKPRYDDLEMIWDIERETPEERSQRIGLDMQYMTLAEVRATENRLPLPEGVPDNVDEMILNPNYLQAIQLIQNKQMMEQQQQMQGEYEQGDFGAPQGDGKQNGQPVKNGVGGTPGGVAMQEPTHPGMNENRQGPKAQKSLGRISVVVDDDDDDYLIEETD